MGYGTRYTNSFKRQMLNGLGSQADEVRKAKIKGFLEQIWPDLNSQIDGMLASDVYTWAKKIQSQAATSGPWTDSRVEGGKTPVVNALDYWIGEIMRSYNEIAGDGSQSGTVGSLAVDYIMFKDIMGGLSRYDAGQINAGQHPLGKPIFDHIASIWNVIYETYQKTHPEAVNPVTGATTGVKKTNWLLIGGIAAGVVALTTGMIAIGRRK